MSTPDRFRRKKQECLREADRAIDELAKQSWLQMAQSWARLADQAERGHFGIDPTPGTDRSDGG
jgi:hypothetical protein